MAWVREHIGAFGGDGDQVTIFGESAGGNSVRRAAAGVDGAQIQAGGKALSFLQFAFILILH